MQVLLVLVIQSVLLAASAKSPVLLPPGYYYLVKHATYFGPKSYIRYAWTGELQANGKSTYDANVFRVAPGQWKDSFYLSCMDCSITARSPVPVTVFNSMLVTSSIHGNPVKSEFFAYNSKTRNEETLYTIQMAHKKKSWWRVHSKSKTIEIGKSYRASYFSFIRTSNPFPEENQRFSADKNDQTHSHYPKRQGYRTRTNAPRTYGRYHDAKYPQSGYYQYEFDESANDRDRFFDAWKRYRHDSRQQRQTHDHEKQYQENSYDFYSSQASASNYHYRKSSTTYSYGPDDPIPNPRYDPNEGRVQSQPSDDSEPLSDAEMSQENSIEENPEITRILALDYNYPTNFLYWCAIFQFELDRTFTKTQIKKAYYALSKIVHPDKHHDNTERATKAFQRLQEAYDNLLART